MAKATAAPAKSRTASRSRRSRVPPRPPAPRRVRAPSLPARPRPGSQRPSSIRIVGVRERARSPSGRTHRRGCARDRGSRRPGRPPACRRARGRSRATASAPRSQPGGTAPARTEQAMTAKISRADPRPSRRLARIGTEPLGQELVERGLGGDRVPLVDRRGSRAPPRSSSSGEIEPKTASWRAHHGPIAERGRGRRRQAGPDRDRATEPRRRVQRSAPGHAGAASGRRSASQTRPDGAGAGGCRRCGRARPARPGARRGRRRGRSPLRPARHQPERGRDQRLEDRPGSRAGP